MSECDFLISDQLALNLRSDSSIQNNFLGLIDLIVQLGISSLDLRSQFRHELGIMRDRVFASCTDSRDTLCRYSDYEAGVLERHGKIVCYQKDRAVSEEFASETVIDYGLGCVDIESGQDIVHQYDASL